MSNTDLTPALTPEEWATSRIDLSAYIKDESGVVLDAADGTLCVFLESGAICYYPDPHRVIALANHSLPEGDPRRIENADVDAVFFDLAALVDRGGSPDQRSSRLLFKLAALLPPRSADRA